MSYDSNLDRLTVIDLRAIAADLKIAGRSKMKRAELVAVITRAEKDAKWDATHSEDNAQQVDAAKQPDRASYYSGTVPCFERTTVDGIGYGCVKLGEHVEHNTALGAAWWTPAETDEQADAEARTYSFVNEVAILRDAPGRAIVTAAFDGRTVGGSIVRKGKRLVLVAGTVTVTGNSFEKVAKLFAMKLGFRADRIDVARGF